MVRQEQKKLKFTHQKLKLGGKRKSERAKVSQLPITKGCLGALTSATEGAVADEAGGEEVGPSMRRPEKWGPEAFSITQSIDVVASGMAPSQLQLIYKKCKFAEESYSRVVVLIRIVQRLRQHGLLFQWLLSHNILFFFFSRVRWVL